MSPDVPLHDGAAERIAWRVLRRLGLGHDTTSQRISGRILWRWLGHNIAAQWITGARAIGCLGAGSLRSRHLECRNAEANEAR